MDVLISVKGTVARVGIVPEEFAGNISRDLARIRVRQCTSPHFVYYQLQSGPVQRTLALATVGTTRLELSIGILRSVRIPLPQSAAEQCVIAAVLSDVDGLVGALEALIAKKRAIKQAAMQQLLTAKTRLPGFTAEWQPCVLGEIASISKGTHLQSSKSHPDGHYPHFNGGTSPSSYTDNFNTPANTIAISEGGNSCGHVQLVPQPFWCGGHCYALHPKDVDKRFLYYSLKVRQSAIMGLRVGSGLPNVQKSALAAFALRIPCENTEQTAIATVLSDMDAEIAALEQRLQKARAIKQGMMQQLLTGRIRLITPAAPATPEGAAN